MPSFVTHHIFAATVQRVTGEATARIAEQYPAGYRWGAMGPDPLYYYHAPFPGSVTRLARRMHAEASAPLFAALCEAAEQQHDTAALAYISGFCTHYALDRVSHSFIEAQADRLALFVPGSSREVRRRLVGSELDSMMIAEYISPEPAKYEAYTLLDPNAAECTVLARVLSLAAKAACGVRLTPAAVYRSLHDMRKTLRLAHNGVPARKRLERLERLLGHSGWATSLMRPDRPFLTDCSNQEHQLWSAGDIVRTESFCDLFDAAVPLAVSLQRAVLEHYYQKKPLDERFFPTNFYGEVTRQMPEESVGPKSSDK